MCRFIINDQLTTNNQIKITWTNKQICVQLILLFI